MIALLTTLVLGLAAGGGATVGPERLTLDEALARARQANAELPVAALDPRIARQKLREAQAQRRTILSSDGELWIAPASGYDTTVTDQGDERLQVVAERTVYDGGGLAAQERRARADVGVAEAHYRRAVADVEQQVTGGVRHPARGPPRDRPSARRGSSARALPRPPPGALPGRPAARRGPPQHAGAAGRRARSAPRRPRPRRGGQVEPRGARRPAAPEAPLGACRRPAAPAGRGRASPPPERPRPRSPTALAETDCREEARRWPRPAPSARRR